MIVMFLSIQVSSIQSHILSVYHINMSIFCLSVLQHSFAEMGVVCVSTLQAINDDQN